MWQPRPPQPSPVRFAAPFLPASGSRRRYRLWQPDIVRSIGAVPLDIAGRFRSPSGFQQSASGQYFVSIAGAHTVFWYRCTTDERLADRRNRLRAWPDHRPDRIFGRARRAHSWSPTRPTTCERIQIFSPAGFRIRGLPAERPAEAACGPGQPGGRRHRLDAQYTGTSILISQPDTSALITEYTLAGGVNRLIGTLRRTGHEDDPDLHVALNTGVPLIDPNRRFLCVPNR